MDSKIMIDLDEEGQPRIKIDYKLTEDLRDRLVGRFLYKMGIPDQKNVEWALVRLGHENNEGSVAFIESTSTKKENKGFLIILGMGNVVKKDVLDDNDLIDAEEGHSSIINLDSEEVAHNGIWLPIEKSI